MVHIETILVPIDFSEHASRALDYAIELAEHFGAELHLLHSYPLHPSMASAAYGEYVPADLDGAFREAANEQLRACAEKVAARGLHVETNATPVPAADAISAHAEKVQADLIVMGTRGLTGLKHVLLGSVAERTVRMAPCPVVTLKAS
jgi:nucleotide-binding universal stress UspA family protein